MTSKDLAGVTLPPHSATLVALGAQWIITQKRPTSFRGRVTIYADDSLAGWGRPGSHSKPNRRTFGGWTVEHDMSGLLIRGAIDHPYRIPDGVIVASASLVDCVPVSPEYGSGCMSYVDDFPQEAGGLPHQQGGLWLVGSNEKTHGMPTRMEDQLPFSDFTPGRHAWLLDDIEPVHRRCPVCWGSGGVSHDPCPMCNRDGVGEFPGKCRPFRIGEQKTPRGRVWTWNVSTAMGQHQ